MTSRKTRGGGYGPSRRPDPARQAQADGSTTAERVAFEQLARERRNEIGVLKTLGFGSRLVMALVLAESLILGILGGAVGLALGSVMIRVLPKLPFIGDAVAQFPNLGLSLQIATLGFGIALLIGVCSGFIPALIAYRSKITDSLRTV